MSRAGRLLSLAVFMVAAGAATSYLVAWCGIALDSYRSRFVLGGQLTGPATPIFTLSTEHRRFSDSVVLAVQSGDESFTANDQRALDEWLAQVFRYLAGQPESGFRHGIPAWVRQNPPAHQKGAECSSRAAGWPRRCVRSHTLSLDDSPRRLHGAIDTTSFFPAPARQSRTIDLHARTLPLFPHWPGLLVNTALYAGAWGLILLILTTLRRFVHRPGACRTCGYDLRGLSSAVCPECGAPAGGRSG